MAVVVFLSSMAVVLFVAHWSMLNWRVWQYKNEWEGLVIYGAVRQVDDLEELDIGIPAMAAIPVGAAGEGIGESNVHVQPGNQPFTGYGGAMSMRLVISISRKRVSCVMVNCVPPC